MTRRKILDNVDAWPEEFWLDLVEHHLSKYFRVGEKVEIISNTLALKQEGMKPPFYGRVKAINGEYILIRPRYRRWESEWYRSEIRKISTLQK